MIQDHAHPALRELTARLVALWPEHADYVEKSFDGRAPEVMESSERIADCALRLARTLPEGLGGLCADYRFLCEQIILPEELYFRRHNRYRLSRFADAYEECYANAPFMARYMNGVLLSHVFWRNHAHAISSYMREFLPSLKPGSDLLEIGPGHGILLYFATQSPNIRSVSGWDVSPTSIAHTSRALETLGVGRPVVLQLQNLFDAGNAEPKYDAIVMSEVLEHLEDPIDALHRAKAWLKPGGAIWVNVPANSPCPDHIYLIDSPEHAGEMVRSAGLEVESNQGFPMTGATLEKARKRKLSISCVIVGRAA